HAQAGRVAQGKPAGHLRHSGGRRRLDLRPFCAAGISDALRQHGPAAQRQFEPGPERGRAIDRRQQPDLGPQPGNAESALYSNQPNGGRSPGPLSQPHQGTRGQPGRYATAVERTSAKERQRPALHPVAGAAGGGGKLSQKRSRSESPIKRRAQAIAPRHRRTGESPPMVQHRRHAAARQRRRPGPGLLQTQTHSSKMNRKQLLILLVLLVVVGGAGLWLRRNQNASWDKGDADVGKKLLGDLPVNDIASVTFKQGTNELSLVKKPDLWRVSERNDYPANFSELDDFLVKVHDLKIIQSQKVGASQLPRLALAPGSGTNAALVIDFKDHNGKPLRSLLLGKEH